MAAAVVLHHKRGASNVTIYGGSFVNNEVKGDLKVDDKSQHTNNLNSHNKATSNVADSYNDNSRRISGSRGDEEIPSMTSRSADYQEDHTQPPPQGSQRPQYPPPQAGSTATNVNSGNVENTNVKRAFNDNSQTYYQGGAPPANRMQHNVPNWMSGPEHGGGGLPSTSGLHGSGQFLAPGQVPFQAAFPQQPPPMMGFGSPPGPHMSMTGANIQHMDQLAGQNFERWLNIQISQSMPAGNRGGNFNPQAAYPSPSRNVEASDSINTGMANLTLNNFQPKIPTHPSEPTPFSSDHQISLKPIDQLGSPNPFTNTLSPHNNAVQQNSHCNPAPAPRTTESPQYGNNPKGPPPPPSTFPFNFPPPPFNGGPNSNIPNGNLPNDSLTKRDGGVHHTNKDSFNQHNKTIQDSFNNNSLVDFTGKRSATEIKKKRELPKPPDVQKETSKGKNSSGPDPTNRMDEDHSSEEIDEQISAEESIVDSSGKKKKGKKWGRPFFA